MVTVSVQSSLGTNSWVSPTPKFKLLLDLVRAWIPLGCLVWQRGNPQDLAVLNLRGLSPSSILPQQVKPNIFSSSLDRIDWPELLWTNYSRLLYTPSSIHANLGNSILCWKIVRAWLCITKAEQGAACCVFATNFSESFISRAGAAESEKHWTWLEGEFITLPGRVNKTEALSITVGSGTTLAANICSNWKGKQSRGL